MTLVKTINGQGAYAYIVAVIVGVLVLFPSTAHARDNNLVGYELYQRNDFGSAAETFEDTQWRGVSLYRSGQWWRAAEAFVRGNDATAFYNLGNTYVRMGYYALALEAYQQALQVDPTFEDAAFNANLMKQLIALKDNNEDGQSLLQPDALGEISKDDESTGSTGSPDGGEDTEDTEDSEGNTESRANNGEQTPSERAVQAESGPAAESDERQNSNRGERGASTVTGIESEAATEQNAAGKSESDSDAGAARWAGVRTQVEAEQATEQWLNRIQHNPIVFLQKHIELETRRRRAAGQQAPEGGDGW